MNKFDINGFCKVGFMWILLSSANIQAQDRDDFIGPFFGYYGSQSLATAVGMATVASGQTIPGRSSNPANLGFHRFGSVQMNFTSANFESGVAARTESGIGSIYAVLPARVFQGSLVYSVGILRDNDFTEAHDINSVLREQSGGIYSTELAVAVEFVQNMMVGIQVNYLQGGREHTLDSTDTSYSSLLKPKYKGISTTIGFVQRASPFYQLGASVQLPSLVWVNEKYTIWDDQSIGDYNSESHKYELHRPLSFHLGGAFFYQSISAFYEMEWTDWGNLEFSSDEYYTSDIVDINSELSAELTSTMAHKFGLAYHPPILPTHFYLGFQRLPVPFKGEYDNDVRHVFSGGMSHLLNQQFSLHGSFSNYFWNYAGVSESYFQSVFGVSLHF